MNLIELNKRRIAKNLQDSYIDLEKGKKASIGEIRTWDGKKVQKQANGEWKEVTSSGSSSDKKQDAGDSHLPERYRNEFPSEAFQEPDEKIMQLSPEEGADLILNNIFGDQGSSKLYHNVKLVMENSGLNRADAIKKIDEYFDDFGSEMEEGFESKKDFNEYKKEMKDIINDADALPSQKGRKEDQAYKDKKQKKEEDRMKAFQEKWKDHKFDPKKEGTIKPYAYKVDQGIGIEGLSYTEPFLDGEISLSIWGGTTISFSKNFSKSNSKGSSTLSSVGVEDVNKENYFSKMFELTNKLMDSEIGKEMGKEKVMKVAPKLIENFLKYNTEQKQFR